MTRTRTAGVIALATLTLACSAPVWAQGPDLRARPQRPYRGLFGGGFGDTEQILSVGVSLSGGFDDSAAGAPEGSGAGVVAAADQFKPGPYSQGGAALRYSLTRQKISFGVSTAALGRYEPANDSAVSDTYSVTAGVNLTPRTGTDVRFSQTAALQPYLVLLALPGLDNPDLGMAELSPLDYQTARQRYRSLISTVSITQDLSRRVNFRGSYRYKRSDFPSHFADFGTQNAEGSISYSIARGLAIRGGYGIIESVYLLPGAPSLHRRSRTFDGGIDFNRSLSFSRRTTLSFSTGTSALQDGLRTDYHVTGTARLGYEIGRSWNASLGYDRSAGFQEAFLEPVYSDGLNVGIQGFLSRRVRVHTGVGAATGDIGSDRTSHGFSNYTASTTIGVAVGRKVEIGVDHAYYRHSYQPGVPLPAGVPYNLGRQSIRVFITYWEPLFVRRRRP